MKNFIFILSLCYGAMGIASPTTQVAFRESPDSQCKFDENITRDFPKAVAMTEKVFPPELLPTTITAIESCEIDSIDAQTVGLSSTGVPLLMEVYIHEFAHSILGKFLGRHHYDLQDQYSDVAYKYWHGAKELKKEKESLESQVWYESGLDEFFADITALVVLEKTVFNPGNSDRNYGEGPSEFDMTLQAGLRKSGMFDPHYFLAPIWKPTMALAVKTQGSDEKKRKFLGVLMGIIKEDIETNLEFYREHPVNPDELSKRIGKKLSLIN